MRLKTILKELDKIIGLWEKGARPQALERLYQLRNRIAYKIQEEQEKEQSKNPTAYNLAKWYYGIWQGKIPEGNFGRVVNVFKELLEELKLSEEEIKETYLWWLNLKEEDVPKHLYKTYSIALTDKETRAITDFKGKLRYIKGLKNKLEEESTGWISKEFRHSEDSYQIFSADELLENESKLSEAWDDAGKKQRPTEGDPQ